MVDIYDNLENYEEIHGYDRLKTENEELKQKIGEYEFTLAKLQKDFDELTTEHQRLLANYSSLLKTARAEIERKTQVITTINKEKDQLFLKFLSDSTNKKPVQGKKGGKGKAKIKENVPVPAYKPTPKEAHLQHGSKDDHSTKEATNDECQKQELDLRTLIEEKKNKENKNSHNVPCHIASRRKSAPISRLDHPVFSSDEEDGKSTAIKSIPSRAEIEIGSERFIENRLRQLASEVCILENRDEHQRESQRESLIDRPTRYSRDKEAHDRYRVRYDDKSRDRDRSSHERPQRGRPTYRESNERYRNDHSRPRASPPRGNYQRNKSRDRRREFFERERQEPEFDRYRKPFHHDQPVKHKYHDEYVAPGSKHKYHDEYEAPGSKHKYHDEYETPGSKQKYYDDYEEPLSKRRRTDSRNADDYLKDVAQSQGRSYQHWRSTSCQSPDEVFVDTVLPSHPIREIMSTSETPQPDPRLLSNKYVEVCDGSKKMRLSASAAQVKLTKVGPWIDTPDDQRSPDIREAIPNKVYSRIENNLANDSMESGEINDVDIYSEIFTDRDNIQPQPRFAEDNVKNSDIREKKPDIPPKTSAIVEVDTKIEKAQDIYPGHEHQIKETATEKPIVNEDRRLEYMKNYKIRKISKPESTFTGEKCSSIPKPLEVLYNQLTESELARKKHISGDVKHVPPLNSGIENNNSHNDSKSEPLKADNYRNKSSTTNAKQRPDKNYSEVEKEKYRETKNTKSTIRPCSIANIRKSLPAFKHELPRLDFNDEVDATQKNNSVFTLNTPAKRNMVAGDLELSDESSDSSDLKIQISKPKIDNKKDLKHLKQLDKSKSKEKEPDKHFNESKTKDIQAKLCDLFGDSSLLTPEDLELQLSPPNTEPSCDQSPFTPAAPSALSFSSNLKENVKLTKSSANDTQIDSETDKIRTRSSGKSKSHVDDKNTKSSAMLADEKVKCNEKPIPEDKSNTSDVDYCLKTKANDAAVADSTVAVELPLEVTIPEIPISVEPTDNLIRVIPSVEEKEPDVLKTVIISTGMQPQCLTIQPKSKKIAENTDKSEDTQIKIFPGLATSTPQRESVKVALKDKVRAPSVMSDTSDSNCTDKMAEIFAPEESLSGTPSKYENAPDVRVVLKRKRKPKRERSIKSNVSQ